MEGREQLMATLKAGKREALRKYLAAVDHTIFKCFQ